MVFVARKPEHIVTITVNEQPASLEGHSATGTEIKVVAIAQGVAIQPNFVLQEELPNGTSRIVGDNDIVRLRTSSVHGDCAGRQLSGRNCHESGSFCRHRRSEEAVSRCHPQHARRWAGGRISNGRTVALSDRFVPNKTWVGFHIPAQYPYADIYPMFIGGDVRRADGQGFAPPVTTGHAFEGRSALQISRRNSMAQNGKQKVCAKVLKVLDFLERSS